MTIFVDYKNKRPRELVLGRSSGVLQAGIQSIEGRENVLNVVMDLSRSYKTFVKEYFCNAEIVADKFHVLRLLTKRLSLGFTELAGITRPGGL